MMRWALGLIVIAGCAPLSSLPPREILLAQSALARAEGSPFARLADEELGEAEAALTAAERAYAEDPSSPRAWDEAYVAWRAAEKAWVAGRCEAAREASRKARRAAEHLAADLARKEAFLASIARRRAAQAVAKAEVRRAIREALRGAEIAGASVVDRPDAMIVRFSAEALFLPGTSLFRDGAEDRLDALCRGLRGAPPFELRFAIVDDIEGFRTSPLLLAARRYERICEAMCARGVPIDAIGGRDPHPPPGAQIDVIVIAPEPPLPPDD